MPSDISAILKQIPDPIRGRDKVQLGYIFTPYSPPGRIESIFERMPLHLRENPKYAVLDIGSCWGRTTKYMQERYGIAIGLEIEDILMRGKE